MSKIKVNRLENTSTVNGGIDIDTSGNVQVDGSLKVESRYEQKVVSYSVGNTNIDIGTNNYIVQQVDGNITFAFTGSFVTSGYAQSWVMEIDHVSGTITWPAAVKWPSDTAPTLTTGKKHLFFFVTDNSGTSINGACIKDYVS
tara:strand:- start:1087 stop:1515 length:429 start_codon:yes stop_codon:yes gene_type:complete